MNQSFKHLLIIENLCLLQILCVKDTHTQGHALYHPIFMFHYNWPVIPWWTQLYHLTFTCNLPFEVLYDVILLESQQPWWMIHHTDSGLNTAAVVIKADQTRFLLYTMYHPLIYEAYAHYSYSFLQSHFRLNYSQLPCVWDEPDDSILASQIYLVPLFLVYGRWCRLAGAWHATGSSWSSTRVEEGRALQSREDPQTSRPNPCPSHTRSLLLGHLLQFCSQLLRIHTRRTLPTYWNKSAW